MIRIVDITIELLFSLFQTIITGIFDFIVAFVTPQNKNGFSASFLPSHKLLSSSAKGFCLTGDKSLSIDNSITNSIVFGGSGSGKSSQVLIPSILKMMGASSLVIHDPSGELAEKTSGALKSSHYDVKFLNWIKPEQSEYFNPLHRIKNISDIKKISKILIHTSLGGGGKDPFWNMSAEGILTIFIRYIIFHTEKEFHSLFNVLCLINAFAGTPQKVDLLFIKTDDDNLLAEYKSFVSYDSKMLMSIVATARTALSIFSDPQIAQITSRDTINFESFRKEKTILYINNNVNDMKYYTVLSSIFFEQFFANIMSHLLKKNELPIFFLLDEASSLYLNILPIAISNIRKYFSGIMLVFQSQNQLIDLYGVQQGRNILANSFSKVYMPGVPLDVAKELESILGKYEFIDDDNARRTRPLLTADEIRTLNEAIILCGNFLPIKSRMTPYYKQRALKHLTELLPYEPQQANYSEYIPEIQFT